MFLSKVLNAAKTLFFGILLCLLNGNIVWAASEKLNLDTEIDPVPTPMPSMFSLLVKLMLSLIIVGGLAYLTIRFLKKNAQITGSSENISVLDQFALGMNKGLFIVEVADKVLVLGVTDHNINFLYEIKDSKIIDELRTRAAERESQPIIPPRFWEVILSKTGVGNLPAANFSSHIQEQVKKLQNLADSTKNKPTGKDDQNG